MRRFTFRLDTEPGLTLRRVANILHFAHPAIAAILGRRARNAMAGCRLGVKTGKGQREHMSSAVLPITDIAKILRHVRYVPILLQKSKIEQPQKSRES